MVCFTDAGTDYPSMTDSRKMQVSSKLVSLPVQQTMSPLHLGTKSHRSQIYY